MTSNPNRVVRVGKVQQDEDMDGVAVIFSLAASETEDLRVRISGRDAMDRLKLGEYGDEVRMVFLEPKKGGKYGPHPFAIVKVRRRSTQWVASGEVIYILAFDEDKSLKLNIKGDAMAELGLELPGDEKAVSFRPISTKLPKGDSDEK